MKCSFLLSIVSLFLISCGDSDTVQSDLEAGTIEANINGNKFSTSFGYGQIISILDTETFSIASIDLQNIDVISFSFQFMQNQDILETEYISTSECDNIDAQDICFFSSYGLFDNNSAIEYYNSVPGEFMISIESIDYRKGGHAIGSFSGTLETDELNSKSITISEGKFNIKINE